MNKQHKKPRCDDMYRAILTLKTVDECKQFFDVCFGKAILNNLGRYSTYNCIGWNIFGHDRASCYHSAFT